MRLFILSFLLSSPLLLIARSWFLILYFVRSSSIRKHHSYISAMYLPPLLYILIWTSPWFKRRQHILLHLSSSPFCASITWLVLIFLPSRKSILLFPTLLIAHPIFITTHFVLTITLILSIYMYPIMFVLTNVLFTSSLYLF